MTAEAVQAGIEAALETIAALKKQTDAIRRLADGVVETLRAGGRIYTCGNGGSAAEALHMAEELVGRYRGNRRSLPGICLAADCTALTCIGNDFGYDELFARQIEGLVHSGDLVVLFSTSGRAANLARAVEAVREAGARSAALLGRDGGPLRGRCDFEVIVPGSATEHIQEAHQVILHLVLDAVEQAFPPPAGEAGGGTGGSR